MYQNLDVNASKIGRRRRTAGRIAAPTCRTEGFKCKSQVKNVCQNLVSLLFDNFFRPGPGNRGLSFERAAQMTAHEVGRISDLAAFQKRDDLQMFGTLLDKPFLSILARYSISRRIWLTL